MAPWPRGLVLSDREAVRGGADLAGEDEGARHPVWLGLLGSFRLLRNGAPVFVRSGGKTEALLAQLGLATHAIPRHVLLETIWPDSDLSLAGNALNNLVHKLRELLCDALGGASPVVQAAGHYRLNHEAGVAVDVAHFQALVARVDEHARSGQLAAAAALAERAVHLYRGDLAPADNASARAILERDRLRASCLTLLMHLADYAFQRGDFGACLGYALQLLAYDPCREDAHRLVMRCYVRRGERAQGLRHYRTVQAVLSAEFDVEPEPATTRLFEQIRLAPGAV